MQNVSQSPSRGHQDDRPIKASGQYNIGGYQNSRFDDGDDEAAIMGETLQTMEMTKVNRKDLKKKPDGEFETLKTQEIYDQKLNEKVHDDFPADFEDTGEPAAEIDDLYEADEPSCRLTQKQGQKELKDVLDEYKKFVKRPDEFQMANSSHFSELPSNYFLTQPSKKQRTSQEPRDTQALTTPTLLLRRSTGISAQRARE